MSDLGGRPRRAVIVWTGLALALLGVVVALVLSPAEAFHGVSPLGDVITLRRGHETYLPFDATWALSAIRETPARALGAILLGTLVLVGLARLPSVRARPLRAGSYWTVGLAMGALALALPVDHERNTTLGDGLTLATNVGRGMTFGAEIGTSELMVAMVRLFAQLGEHDGLVALRALDAIVAVIFGASAVLLADGAARTVRGRAVLTFGLLAAGTTIQLMGYVETTMLELGALALYLGAAAHVVGPLRQRPSAGPLAFTGLGLATIAHGAGPLALPSVAALTFAGGRVDRRRLAHHAVLFVCCVCVPFLFVVAPRWLANDLGNADGGGDHIRFVPAELDWAHPPSNMVYYTRFSGLHLADVANALLLGAPIALPVLLGLVSLGRLARPSAYVVALLVAAAFTVVIPLFWNHDFGMWGDWNLATTYLFPLHALSWVWLVQVLERCDPGPRATGLVVGALGALQMVGLVGLVLQLY